MIEQINKGVEQLLLSLSESEYSEEIEYAFNIFKRPFSHFDLDVDIEHGFNGWLIHDYKFRDGQTLAKKVLDSDQMISIITESVYSVFLVNHEKQNIVFKDLFTGRDYVLNTEQAFEAGDLLSVRLYPVGEKYLVLDNAEFYEPSMEQSIRQSVMSKYNEYCSSNEPIGIDVFVKEHSQLVYHLTNIIHYYEAELEEESDLAVFIAEYGIKEREILLDSLLATDYFQIIETYEDEMTLILLDDGIQIAELLVTSHKLEIEANSKAELSLSRSILDQHADGRAAFLKEAELSLDDVLNNWQKQ